ncbi:MAG: hypothetical protein AAFX87_00795 [Bacteroidota bacterium]
MESEKNLTSEESLALITRMISQAKRNFADGSFYFLLWGYVVLIAYLGNYVLFRLEYDAPFLVWLITLPAAVISGIHGYRRGKRSKVRTYTDQMYNQVWLSLLVPFITFIVFGFQLGYENLTGLILLLASSGVFMTGRLMKFKPAVFSSFFLSAGAILALVYNSEMQYLIGAVSIIFGYLVPGYMLRKLEKNG